MASRFLYMACIALLMVAQACKQGDSQAFSGNEKLNAIDSRYKEDPTQGLANEYMQALFSSYSTDNTAPGVKKAYLLKGLEIATEQNIPSRRATFLYPLVKDFNTDPETGNRLYELALIMKKLNKVEAASTLFKGLTEKYPKSELAQKAGAELETDIPDINAYVLAVGEKIFDESENTGLNRNNSHAFVDVCEAYALVYSDAPQAPDNLFKAAEVAKSLRTYPKAMSLYDWILDKYPDYPKAPTTLFLKGFIVENNLGDDEQAKAIYELFLSTYPDHDLADDVAFLIENIGKSDEEILEMIEQKRQSPENQ